MVSPMERFITVNKWFISGIGLLFSTTVLATSDQTTSLHALLEKTLNEHPLIQAVDADVETVQSQLKAEKSAWYPKLSVREQRSQSDISRAVGDDSNMTTTQRSIGLNQLVWDFGAVQYGITRAYHAVENKQLESNLQRQNLILAGTEAYIKLRKSFEVLEYAKRSEENIKQQAQLESTRIEAGRGYTTDLLQAKAQLAGAQARYVVAEGALSEALHRFEAVFGATVEDPKTLIYPEVSNTLLPLNEAAVIAAVTRANPDVLPARVRTEIARSEAAQIKAREYYPRINATAETRYLKDVDGVEDIRSENSVGLALDWSFDLGLGQRHAVKAAQQQIASKQENADYVLLQALEEARNAWNSLSTAQKREYYLKDQVDIAAQFLKMSRTEREMGRRSLLDVLSGETTLINAQSDSASAHADVLIASFRVLRSIGKLDLKLFRDGHVGVSYAEPTAATPTLKTMPATSAVATQILTDK